jgi:hypothetical protein
MNMCLRIHNICLHDLTALVQCFFGKCDLSDLSGRSIRDTLGRSASKSPLTTLGNKHVTGRSNYKILVWGSR